MSGRLWFRFGAEEDGARAKDLVLAVNWSDSQLGRSKAAPTVGLSKIGCFNDQIIFKITCVYLY